MFKFDEVAGNDFYGYPNEILLFPSDPRILFETLELRLFCNFTLFHVVVVLYNIRNYFAMNSL